MPTTETVAPTQGATREDVAEGLREVADLIDRLCDVNPAPQAGQAPIHADLKVLDRASVNAFALIFGETPTTSTVGPVEVIKTSGRFGGVHLTVHAVFRPTHVLRRDCDATAALAERDA